MLLAGRGVQRLARVDFNDPAVTAAEASDALGDPQVLAMLVGVPGGPAPGAKRTVATTIVWSGSWGSAIGSSQTSPANCAAGFFAVGMVGSMFMIFPYLLSMKSCLATPIAAMPLGQPA